MIPAEIQKLFVDYAMARSLYAKEWLQQYESGQKMKACDMATDASPAGIAYHTIKKQTEYLIVKGHEQNKEDLQQD